MRWIKRQNAAGCYGRAVVLSAAWLAAMLALAPPADTRPVKRGNSAIARRSGPIFTVAAAARLGILLAGGAKVIQPIGFGAGFRFRVHALHLGPLRLGGGVELGHTRFMERRVVSSFVGGADQTATRYAALGHTDLSLGPSLQLLLGPVYVQGDFGVGLGISTFSRPRGALTIEEEHHSDVTAMIRGGGELGIPIRNNQGIAIGSSVQRYFSKLQIVGNPPDDPELDGEPDTNPFDLFVEVTIAYTFMF
jgi:hypothetical protein